LDVKNKHAQRAEQFIILDSSLLKNTLTESGEKAIQGIFEHVITESRDELNTLLDHFATTVEELKTPPTTFVHLK
jgi:hypothetical protein